MARSTIQSFEGMIVSLKDMCVFVLLIRAQSRHTPTEVLKLSEALVCKALD